MIQHPIRIVRQCSEANRVSEGLSQHLAFVSQFTAWRRKREFSLGLCREVDSLRFETATVRALELQSTNSPFIPVGIFLHHYPPASSFLSHPTHRLVGVARSALRSLRKARRTHLQSEAGRFFRKATAAVDACCRLAIVHCLWGGGAMAQYLRGRKTKMGSYYLYPAHF